MPRARISCSQAAKELSYGPEDQKEVRFLSSSFPPFPNVYFLSQLSFLFLFLSSTSDLSSSTGGPSGLYSSYRGGRGGHPLMVPQYTKDHLKSIISLPPDWPGNDTTQMILGILAHHQRVSSSPVRADEI